LERVLEWGMREIFGYKKAHWLGGRLVTLKVLGCGAGSLDAREQDKVDSAQDCDNR
jgi:hypothetical protein